MITFAEYVELNQKALGEIPRSAIDRFTEGLSAVRLRDGTLWVAGNGGSAASASHAVADFGKTVTGNGSSALRTIALSEMVAMQTAFSNDDSFESAFALSLRNYAKKGDAVMILSVSGLSPNLLAASRVAMDMGLTLFSIVGLRGKDLAAISDFALTVDSNDYQVVENAQMSLIHWFVKVL
jgi:D-sedoheptulose 7-phosphate isomerase